MGGEGLEMVEGCTFILISSSPLASGEEKSVAAELSGLLFQAKYSAAVYMQYKITCKAITKQIQTILGSLQHLVFFSHP